MRLNSVLVKNFRCIDDSGRLSLKQVTCLVGKNESGKTAILKALHKLKPEDASRQKYIPSQDYPRRRWRPSVQVPTEPPVVDSEWELSDSDLATLEGQFGKGAISKKNCTVRNGYNNRRELQVEFDEQAIAAHFVAKTGLTTDDFLPNAKLSTIKDLRDTLASIATKTEKQQRLSDQLTGTFPSGTHAALSIVIDAMIPTFLYFDEYLRLPGQVSIDALLQRKASNQLSDNDNIFIALLGLAGTSVEEVNQAGTFEEFNSALRAVSNQVSEQIFAYWSQNRHLGVEARLDLARPQDEAPFNSGYIFRTRIVNHRHKADTSFDDRSSGFVWFFSFLVWFNRFRDTKKKNLIILLDEPGLSLHARAQKDLLRYINEQLAPTYQVIYTTHSPFMIDPDNILSCRTVEDVVVKDKTLEDEKLLGTKVGDDVLSTDPDTISPLQRALDYEITQSLFIGRHNLLVEGASDLLYLKWFSKQLTRVGKSGLDYRWNICRVGGIDRIPGFVSLFRGNRLNVAALVDVQKGHKQKIENARASLENGQLLTAEVYAGQPEADIEDILGYEFYRALLNKAFNLLPNLELPLSRPASSPVRVVEFAESHFRMMPPTVPEFDHYTPAEFLFQSDQDGCSLPGYVKALAAFEKLVEDLNKLLK
jgi:predicted ATP-dependent endonuclease of OLD family